RSLHFQRNEPGQEEVRVDKLVPAPLASGELQHERRKVAHVREQVFLPHVLRRPGGNVDDTDARYPLRRLRKQLAVASGEDIDLVAGLREILCQLADVDVLATAIDAAEHAQWRR